MRQHDALGHAGRPRRVDDREHRFGRDGLGVARPARPGARRPTAVPAARSSASDCTNRDGAAARRRAPAAASGRPASHRVSWIRCATVNSWSRSADQLVALRGVLDDHDLRARVAHDELALLGRVRGVDRHRRRRPPSRIATSHSTHSSRVCDTMQTRSPGNDAARDQAGGDLARASRRPRGTSSPARRPCRGTGTRRPPGVAATRRFHSSTAVRGSSLRRSATVWTPGAGPADRRSRGAVIGCYSIRRSCLRIV